jgi:hypothetical protein
MKKSLPEISAFFAALFFAACVPGGNDENPVKTNGKDTSHVAGSVTPGFYAGDYSAIPDPRGYALESELSLGGDGSFRMFWLSANEPVLDLTGKWAQDVYDGHDGLLLSSQQELWVGQLDSLLPAPDDTNRIEGVKTASFYRQEYTPYQQKPVWVPYVKKDYPLIKDGDYVFVVPGDSGTPDITLKISLKGSDFVYTFTDSIDEYMVSSKWFQIGTVFATTDNKRKYYSDSLKAFPATWDDSTMDSEILYRVRNVTESGFQMWNPPPPGIPDTGSWTIYTKK